MIVFSVPILVWPKGKDSASHLDECGNPMDYDVIWESKEIEDCKNGDIATLKKRKEVIEFLEDLRKVEKVENIKQENNLQ